MQKKIVLSLGVLIACFLLIIFIIACDKKDKIEVQSKAIGIIGVQDKVNCTDIKYVDTDMKNKKDIRVNIGGMGDTECRPIQYKSNVYVICNDMLKKNIDSKIFIMNRVDGSYNIYTSDVYINDYCVSDYIYTISSKYNEKNISYIEKLSKGLYPDKICRLRVSDVILTEIYATNNYLYATGFNYSDESIYSKLYIINKATMNMVKEIDISDYVIDVSHMIKDKGYLYIGGRTKKNIQGEEIDSTELIRMDIDNYELEKIYIGDKIGHMLLHNDKIYMSNYDSVLDEGHDMYIYDIKTRKIKRYNVKDDIRDMMIKDNQLYLLSKNKLSKYNIRNKITYIDSKTLNREYMCFMKN